MAGYDVATQGAQVREHIGAALQEAALDPYLTAREHMRLQTALHGLPRAERKRRGDELIERVGLSEAADRKVGGYSGGMRRRLDLALALVHGPRILFLDEPTTGLDPQSRTSLWEEVERLASDEGVTVFLTTQYLEEADRLADRVGIIDDGKIVAEGTPAALKAEIAGAVGGGDPRRPAPVRGRDPDPGPLRRRRGAPPRRRRHRRAPGRRRGRAGRRGARAGRRERGDRAPAAARAVAGRRVPGQDRPHAGGRGRGRRDAAEAPAAA